MKSKIRQFILNVYDGKIMRSAVELRVEKCLIMHQNFTTKKKAYKILNNTRTSTLFPLAVVQNH